MPDRNQTIIPRCYPSLVALWLAMLLVAPSVTFTASDAGNAPEGFAANSDVMFDRRCKRGPKQEICDWVKRDHKITAGR